MDFNYILTHQYQDQNFHFSIDHLFVVVVLLLSLSLLCLVGLAIVCLVDVLAMAACHNCLLTFLIYTISERKKEREREREREGMRERLPLFFQLERVTVAIRHERVYG